jgi:hypothetical protein
MNSIHHSITCPLLAFTGYVHVPISFDDIMDLETYLLIKRQIWHHLGTNIDNHRL